MDIRTYSTKVHTYSGGTSDRWKLARGTPTSGTSPRKGKGFTSAECSSTLTSSYEFQGFVARKVVSKTPVWVLRSPEVLHYN